MEEEDVVYLKVFDEKRGDIVFEGKVSTDVEPHELVQLGCFWERGLYGILNKTTNEAVKRFKGLQNNVELVAGRGDYYNDFSGVLYVDVDDKVLRKSKDVPSRECVMISVWELSHEECEKMFKCETLEELEMNWCNLRQIAKEIGKMKKLKKVTLYGLKELKSIPEEIGELSNLEELWIGRCGIESLPKRLKKLKRLKSISLLSMTALELHEDDLVVFSKLKHLTICWCGKAFTPSCAQSLWEMIKSTTDLRVLELSQYQQQDQEMVEKVFEENGSIVDGVNFTEIFAHFFKRNKENHEKALQCVVQLLAIRRWRNVLNGVPKEMVRMIAMMLWNTKCDVNAWTRRSKE